MKQQRAYDAKEEKSREQMTAFFRILPAIALAVVL